MKTLETKITKGEWNKETVKSCPRNTNEWWSAIRIDGCTMDVLQVKKSFSKEEAESNAKLIADAGTTANK